MTDDMAKKIEEIKSTMTEDEMKAEIAQLDIRLAELAVELKKLEAASEARRNSLLGRFTNAGLEALAQFDAKVEALRSTIKSFLKKRDDRLDELTRFLAEETERKAAERLQEINHERDATGESFAVKYNQVCEQLNTDIEALDALSVRYYELGCEASQLGKPTPRGDVVENFLKNRTHTLSEGLGVAINIYRHEKERLQKKAKAA